MSFKRGARSAITITVIMTALLLFSGCDSFLDDASSDNFSGELGILMGTWQYKSPSLTEGYIITDKTLSYIDEFGMGFESEIVSVKRVKSSGAGVVIVRYTVPPAGSASWPYVPAGNYQGIYFIDLNQNSVKLAYSTDIKNNYAPPETKTLGEAKKKFTLAKAGNFVDWSVVNNQQRK